MVGMGVSWCLVAFLRCVCEYSVACDISVRHQESEQMRSTV